MNSNKNGDFTETDGSSYSYEVLAQPSHLLPAGVDKTNREVLHHILLTTHEGRTEEISTIITNQILSLVCDWSKHVTMNEYSPAKTGKYPRIFPDFLACEQAHLFGYREPPKRGKVWLPVQTSEPALRLPIFKTARVATKI